MNIVRRIYHAFFKIWGYVRIKQKIWDSEFQSGKWDYLDKSETDIIYKYIKKYLTNGSILDLGCGSGNTCKDLAPGNYSFFTGVDISEVAIGKARLKCSGDGGKNHKNEFIVSDILSYKPSQRYDLILFRESLYYIPNHKIKTVLSRYSKYLTDNGVIVIRICDRKRYINILRRIRKDYSIREEYESDRDDSTILIFR